MRFWNDKLAGNSSDVGTSDQIRQGPEKMEDQSSDHPGEGTTNLILPNNYTIFDGSEESFLEEFFRHNVQERQKLVVLQESSFLFPLKYVDVVRRTKHYIGRFAGTHN